MTLGVICLFSSGYTAEQQKTINPEGNRVQLQNSNAELQAQINFSRQLMKSKNFEGASALLETLYEKNPSNDLIINLLWKCYEELSYFAKAEEIVRRQVERNPDNMNFQLRDDSRAYKLGFKRIPVEKIGLLENFPHK